MIIRERIYIANVNLKIDILNLRLIKSSYWLLIRGCILLDKVGRNFASYCMGVNCIKS